MDQCAKSDCTICAIDESITNSGNANSVCWNVPTDLSSIRFVYDSSTTIIPTTSSTSSSDITSSSDNDSSSDITSDNDSSSGIPPIAPKPNNYNNSCSSLSAYPNYASSGGTVFSYEYNLVNCNGSFNGNSTIQYEEGACIGYNSKFNNVTYY